MVQVIVDDTDQFDPSESSNAVPASFEYVGTDWKTNSPDEDDPLAFDYRGTLSSLNPPISTKSQLKLHFTGIQAIIQGQCSPSSGVSSQPSCSFTYSVDGASSQNSTASKDSRTLFNSTILEDGNHTIVLSDFDKETYIDVDSAIITAGNSTNLESASIFVNSSAPEIEYEGKWKDVDRARRSITVGDKATFAFSGDYVEVRGIWDTSLSGHVSIAYSFDGRSPETRRYDSSNDYTFAPHFPYFNASLDEISYGNNTHVLSMEVMEVAGVQSFALGAIYYNPSFTSLSDMSNLTLSGSASATSSTPNESSIPVPRGGSGRDDESPALTIAVPVVIGLIGVILLVLGVWLFMKRKRRPRMPSKSDRAIIEVEEGIVRDLPRRREKQPLPPSTASSYPAFTTNVESSILLPSDAGVSDEPEVASPRHMMQIIRSLQDRLHVLQQEPPPYSSSRTDILLPTQASTPPAKSRPFYGTT